MRNHNPPPAVLSGSGTSDKQWLHSPIAPPPFSMLDRPSHHAQICLPRLLHDHASKYYATTAEISRHHHHHHHHGDRPYRTAPLSPAEGVGGGGGGGVSEDCTESTTLAHSSVSSPSNSFATRHRDLPPRASSAELIHVTRPRDRSSPCDSSWKSRPKLTERERDSVKQPFLYTLPSPHLTCQCRSCYMKHIEHVYNDQYYGSRNRIVHKRNKEEFNHWKEDCDTVKDRMSPVSPTSSSSDAVDHIKKEPLESSPSPSHLENSVE